MIFFIAEQNKQSADDSSGSQKQLDQTSQLLANLQRIQYERLSQKLPAHFANVKGPSTEETDLGNF